LKITNINKIIRKYEGGLAHLQEDGSRTVVVLGFHFVGQNFLSKITFILAGVEMDNDAIEEAIKNGRIFDMVSVDLSLFQFLKQLYRYLWQNEIRQIFLKI
jgi:hypothetical protein